MPFTTPADVAAFTGAVYTVAQQTRLATLIPFAERYVARRAGQVFYAVSAPAGDASQDWLLVVSLVAQAYLYAEDAETRSALLGPFASEKLGDYSYTMKDGATMAAQFLDGDPRIAEIISAYALMPALLGVVVNGPTRVAVPVFDPDVSRLLA